MLVLSRSSRVDRNRVVISIPPSERAQLIELVVCGFVSSHGAVAVRLGFECPQDIKVVRAEVLTPCGVAS